MQFSTALSTVLKTNEREKYIKNEYRTQFLQKLLPRLVYSRGSQRSLPESEALQLQYKYHSSGTPPVSNQKEI